MIIRDPELTTKYQNGTTNSLVTQGAQVNVAKRNYKVTQVLDLALPTFHPVYSQVILMNCSILGDQPKDRHKSVERVTKQAKLRDQNQLAQGKECWSSGKLIITFKQAKKYYPNEDKEQFQSAGQSRGLYCRRKNYSQAEEKLAGTWEIGNVLSWGIFKHRENHDLEMILV